MYLFNPEEPAPGYRTVRLDTAENSDSPAVIYRSPTPTNPIPGSLLARSDPFGGEFPQVFSAASVLWQKTIFGGVVVGAPVQLVGGTGDIMPSPGGQADWNSIADKPDVVAAGDTPEQARAAIGAITLADAGYVTTPERYGAKGDGVTDDTAAFQAAVDEVRDTGRGVVLCDPRATYVITRVDIGPGLTIDGRGARVLRPAMSPNWTRTFTTQSRIPPSASGILPLTIRNLVIDGNLANQGPYAGFEQEQSMLVLLSGGSAHAGLLPVVIEDVTVMNSVSDGIHLLAGVTATVRNLRAIDCFRGGLTLSGGNTTLNLDGYEGAGDVTSSHIDMEVDTPGFGNTRRINVSGRNIRLRGAFGVSQGLQITAYDDSTVELQNMEVVAGFSIVAPSAPSGAVTIRDSVLHGYHATFKNTLLAGTSVIFDNVTFIAHAATATVGVVSAIRVTHASTGPEFPRAVTFRDCKWRVGTINPGDTTRAVSVAPTIFANGDVVVIDGGRVAAEFGRGFQLESGGRLHLRNRPTIASTIAVWAASAAASGRQYHLSVEQVQLADTNTTYLHMENGDAANIVEHADTVLDETRNVLTTVSGWGSNTPRGRRIIMLTAAPTASTRGIKGDVARLKAPAAGAAYEWVCVTGSSGTGNIWKSSLTLPA